MIRWSSVLVILTSVACASGDTASPTLTANQPSDADTVNDADDTPALDTGVGDSAEDGSSLDVDEVGSLDTGPGPEQVTLCSEYCTRIQSCPSPTTHSACAADCLGKIGEDADWITSVTCALHSPCDTVAGCMTGPVPASAACAGLCARVAQCDLFPSFALGGTETGCGAFCSVRVFYDPVGYAAVAQCSSTALETGCSDVAVLECSTVKSQQCASICASGNKPGTETPCGHAPEGFSDAAACLAECDGWTWSQRFVATLCVDRFDCGPGTGVCIPPATAPADGLTALCTSSWGLCGGVPGYELPKDPALCALILEGYLAGMASTDTASVAECIDAFVLCPDDPNTLIGCAFPEHSPCEAYCDRLAACGSSGSKPECRPTCWYGHATGSEATTKAIDCVTAAPTCEEVAPCFAP